MINSTVMDCMRCCGGRGRSEDMISLDEIWSDAYASPEVMYFACYGGGGNTTCNGGNR